MVDATCGAATHSNFAEISDKLDIQDNVLRTDVLAEHDPVLSNGLETLEESFHERMAHLEYQLENADSPHLKLALEEEMMNLEREFESLENLVDSSGILDKPGILQIATGQDNYLEALEDAISDMRATLHDSYAEFGTAGMSPDVVVPAEESEHILEDVASDLGGPCQVPADTTTEETGQSQGTEASGEAGGAEQTDGADESSEAADLPDAEEMVNLLSSDPQAFMEELSELDPEDRNTVMMAVQTQMQEINQMFQMASQFSQAMHDTQSAVIQNMRV